MSARPVTFRNGTFEHKVPRFLFGSLPPSEVAPLSGPCSLLASVRPREWLKFYEHSMMASALARDVEEDLEDVEVSLQDLVRGGGGIMVELLKNWEFGPSLVTEAQIVEYVKLEWFAESKARALGDETIAKPKANEAIVFKDFFVCGLRTPPVVFLRQVLESFCVQLHHLTPNGTLVLAKFCWACESFGSDPHLDCFCTNYELQPQPKKITVDRLSYEA